MAIQSYMVTHELISSHLLSNFAQFQSKLKKEDFMVPIPQGPNRNSKALKVPKLH